MNVTHGLSFAESASLIRRTGDDSLKTFVAEHDLQLPMPSLSGLTGYSQLLLLIRRQDQPLGLLLLPHDPAVSVIDAQKLQSELEISDIDHYGTSRIENNDVSCILPPISVVVCTRDRPQALRNCLDALSKLVYNSFEVIVVDNASSTREVEQIVARTPFRYVREETPGLDWARNRGAAEADFDIIAYTDDDVIVDRYWLHGISRALRDPAVTAVTGLVIPAELQTSSQHYFQSYGNGMCKGFQQKYFYGAKMSPAELLAAQNIGVGANMAFRKITLDRLGRFDTALDVGTPAAGGGDLDIFHRIVMAGAVICYAPDALVRHQHRRTMRELKRQLYGHGRAYGVYLIKRWREGILSRRQILIFAFSRWIGWLLWRLLLGLCGRHCLPLSLLWMEVWGAFHSPAAYLATYRRDRKVRLYYR